ncbi:MAG: inositol monophosphatase family protein [Bacteriovoracaceae bacterium]
MMASHFSDIVSIVKNHSHPLTKSKHDGSPVTELDLALSSYIETLALQYYPELCFYSEENFNEWKFPLLALDPLDGTREYVEGRSEWSISLGAFANENFVGEGWVCNPMTKEVFTMKTVKPWEKKTHLRGEVSRTEFQKGLFKFLTSEKIALTAVGSIAYKLGRLSHGKMDFVVSKKPKNIWDIAGGTLLCKEAGLEFYSQGKKVTKVEPIYEPPLLWCHPSVAAELLAHFSS